jgi:replicative DNA helicase
MAEINKSRKTGVKSQVKTFYEEHGRIPPQALDFEESVLGAMLIEKEPLNMVMEILKPEAFYKESHQLIFSAVQQLFAKLEPVDTLTVVEQLRRNGHIEEVGGPAYIAQLTRKVLSAANAEYHARIILQKFIQRELIQLSSEVIRKAYEDTTDVFDLLNIAEERLFAVSENHLRHNMNSLPKLLQTARENIEKASKMENNLSGVPSGFTELDRKTSGWQNSDLIIVAARPAMGKTAFVLSLARNLAVSNNRPVAFFSLEMSSVQIATRLLASESQVSSDKIRKGLLDEDEKSRINHALNTLSEAPIYIDDTPALSVFELRTKCRRLKQKNNVELIVIDYMQLMTGSSETAGTREQEISGISRSIKALAKELNVPIICLSQLSRNVEKRPGNSRPQLSDLRESGSIEQDADIVIFLYRAEYYDLQPENGVPGSTEIIISKHRNGPVGSVHLKFIDEIALFKDIENFESFKEYSDLQINENFEAETSGVYTRPSKMNEMGGEPDY